MDIKEFYSQFNKITSEHNNVDDTRSKLTKLMESVKGTKVNDSLDIDIDQIVTDLESQKESSSTIKNVDIDEEQDESYTYDDSYDSSY